MGKSSLKALPRVRRFLLDRRLETGFSMLEAVVVVGVLLALAIAGFFAYGAITQNAKKAAIKDAADKVHTAVVVADTDGDASTKPDDVITDWNLSTGQTYVELLKDSSGNVKRANGDFCVEATNLPDRNVTQRAGSCDDALPGSGGNTGGNNGGNTGGVTPIVDTSTIMRTTWDTSLAGCGTLTLPILGNTDTTIDWGDGTVEPFSRANTYSTDSANSPTHEYATSGVKNIAINGTFDSWGYYSSANNCITNVDSWGDGTKTQSLAGGFFNSTSIASVARIPSTVTDISDIFFQSSFNGDISAWDTSNVTKMSYSFYGSPFAGDISKWNTSKVNTMSQMFAGTTNFNSDISKWNTSNVENMYAMFQNSQAFNIDISKWNVDKVAAGGEWNYADFNTSSILTNDHIPAAFRPATEVTVTPLTSSSTSSIIVNAMNARLNYLASPDLLAALQVRNTDPTLYDSWAGTSNPSQVRKDFESVWNIMANNTGEYATFTQIVNQTSNNIPDLRTNAETNQVTAFYNWNTNIKGQQQYVNAVRTYYQTALDANSLAAVPTVNSNASYTTIPASAGSVSQVRFANAKLGLVSSKYNLYKTWAVTNGYNDSNGFDAFYKEIDAKLYVSPEGVAWQTDVVDHGMDYYDDQLLSFPADPSFKADLDRTSARFVAAKAAFAPNTVQAMTFAQVQAAQSEYISAMQEYYPVAFANVKKVYG